MLEFLENRHSFLSQIEKIPVVCDTISRLSENGQFSPSIVPHTTPFAHLCEEEHKLLAKLRVRTNTMPNFRMTYRTLELF